jgi:vacuolar-type H+-ATPase subunit F/Vma7
VSAVPRVAVLGERVEVVGYGLAGALVLPAETPEDVAAAWQDLPDDVDVVVLTARAAAVLGEATHRSRPPLTVVMSP